MKNVMDIRCGDNNTNILLNGVAGSGKSLILDILTTYCLNNNISVIPKDDSDLLNTEQYLEKYKKRTHYNPMKDPRISVINNKLYKYNIIVSEDSIELGSFVYKILVEHGLEFVMAHFKIQEISGDFGCITINTRQMRRHGINVNTPKSVSGSSF